jgi:glycosyltransferase involved in cell wall biosynthesis
MLAMESRHEQLSSLRKMISKVDAVVVPSEFMAKIMREKVGYNPIAIYHGINTSLFRPIDSRLARAKLGIPANRRVVLWQQRISPEKDLKTLIDAIPIVVKTIPSSLFIIRGRAVGCADYRKHILTYAKRKLSGLQENVKLTLKYVRREQLPYFYAASDLFVLTSRLEAFGLTGAEAMACGTPIVATNTASNPEIVGDAGLLFEPGCSEDLAEKIINILNNEDLRKELGVKARKRVLENFSWNKAAKKYFDLYRSLITQSAAC